MTTTDKLSNLDEEMFGILFSRFEQQNTFFAFFAGVIDKVSDPKIPTIGVAFHKKKLRFTILYNLDFLKEMTEEKLFGVLEHEFYHIVLGHTQHRKLSEDPKTRQIANIAQDLAINSLIERRRLPDCGCFAGEGRYSKYEILLSSDEYIALLMRDKDPNFEKNFDVHIGNEDGETFELGDEYESLEEVYEQLKDGGCDAGKEMAIELLDQAIQQASTTKNKIPHLIKKLNFKKIPPKIPWNKLLSRKIYSFSFGKKQSFKSLRRINRRFPYIFAGTRKKHTLPKILVAIDESGSVSDRCYKKLVETLFSLKSVADFYMVRFTGCVHLPEVKIKDKKDFENFQRKYCGGTNFQAVVEYGEENKYEFIVILTDLLDQPPQTPARIPRVFIAVADRNIRYQQIYVDQFKAKKEIVILAEEGE